jgi:hypothetical protein
MRFRTVVELRGTTATGFQVPPEVVDALGQGKRPPVKVTINGYTYRSTVAVYGGEILLGISAENRAATGVTAGDEIDVDVELDTDVREVTVPDDFAAALNADSVARRFFDGLSYSNKRRFVIAIEDTKSPETRQRRIDKTVIQMREGRL